jgi:hypothetical protein
MQQKCAHNSLKQMNVDDTLLRAVEGAGGANGRMF